MLKISSLTFISCPATVADDLGGLMLQDCADVARTAIRTDGGIHGHRTFTPSDTRLGACKRIEELLASLAAQGMNVAGSTDDDRRFAFLNDIYAARNDEPRDLHAAAGEMLELMEDAVQVHVYSVEDGDRIPANCPHVASIERVRRALGLISSGIETTPVWSYIGTFCNEHGERDDYQAEVVADTAGEALDRGYADLLALHPRASKIDAAVYEAAR